jgi:pyruvate dehydrogenase E2 component (dihydrolipoamide acetyltransferase)
MRTPAVCILIVLAALAAGCGQKGPLVLPDTQHPRKKVKIPPAPNLAPPAAPKTPAAPAPAPSAPAGPAPEPAPPEAAPDSNAAPNPAPQG